jgi:hypothetical protein
VTGAVVAIAQGDPVARRACDDLAIGGHARGERCSRIARRMLNS